MNLFTSIVAAIVILMVFDQTLVTEARKMRKTDGQNHYKAGSTDAFAPTLPGNSPGVGHRNGNAQGFQDDFKPTEGRRLQKTNDFAPTTPGNSPGIGHKKGTGNVGGLKDDLESTEGQKYFKNGSTNDFAPTTPGNSPGIGHKKGDDFAPTTPGHSPGVGHAVKNDEPKA
ncbi:unnamed protein product [Microthlaspi erraticum]|uniref:Precursor of CEP9 n=1 Tax=Microthlaspi erraticum TaxID=1685480 RepID=A0A6D2HT40_9BRAS|nr:unnamed protein product [Microthlaspi erraticum]